MSQLENMPSKEGGEKMPVYETPRVQIPNNLEQRGYKGEAFAQVYEIEEKNRQGEDVTHEVRYGLSIDKDFATAHGTDELDLAPTSTSYKSLEEAKQAADDAVADIANWGDMKKYN